MGVAGGKRRPTPSRRAAVVDIGSNSIRLVVFDQPSRSPVPIFNEKILCGLGRGLGASGRLNDDGAALALDSLVRFVRLARAMRVGRIDLLATAAVREATNGAAFAAEVKRRCGVPIRVLSGADEARLSARGVVCGVPAADGIMGDLGGGSLELVRIAKGRLGAHATLPLGPLRQDETTMSDRAVAQELIDRELARLDWLGEGRGLTFYPVGGAWRTLARIHMEQTNYPLHIIQQYRLARRQAEDFLQLVGGLSRRSLAAMPGMTRRRADVLPFAALLMGRILRLARPDQVEFSAFGLREGFLFGRLPARERKADPLIAGAKAWAVDRFGAMGEGLDRWVAPLFEAQGAAEARLRLAICHLSDLAWREHPDYRAALAFERVLHLPVSGIDHRQRIHAAVAIHVRYGGSRDDQPARNFCRMLDEDEQGQAVALGLALRLAYSLSGATPALLRQSSLGFGRGGIVLRLSRAGRAMFGEAVERRLEALGRAMACPVAVAEA
jgi:exopolyphosphatase/guanosine-5'-triphosphate,3'-diphosphate pyrophosphatase